MTTGLTSEQILRLKEHNVKILEIAFKIQSRQTSIKVKTTEEILSETQVIFNKLIQMDVNPLCNLF